MLGTLPNSRSGAESWQDRVDVFDLPAHVPYRDGMALPTEDSRLVVVGDDGRETSTEPRAVRVLPRAYAAARLALREAVGLPHDGDLSPMNRLRQWLTTRRRSG